MEIPLKFNVLKFLGLGIIAYALYFALNWAILTYFPSTSLFSQTVIFFQAFLLAVLIVLGYSLEVTELTKALWIGFVLAFAYVATDVLVSLFVGIPAFETGKGVYLSKAVFSTTILIMALIEVIISTVIAAVGLFMGLLAAKYIGKH